MKAMRLLIMSLLTVLVTNLVSAQKLDEERMQRDVEVAENVLGTLIKQQFSSQRNFFAIEVNGEYQKGYGITFTIPTDFTVPIIFSEPGDIVIYSDEVRGNAFSVNRPSEDMIISSPQAPANSRSGTETLTEKASKKRKLDMDSVRDSYHNKVIDATKDFLADYAGDLLTQLPANEKIMITNQGQRTGYRANIFNAPKRTLLSTEVLKSDLVALKSGKINRAQLLSRIKVVNTQTVDAVEPDLELLTSIFNRLYRADLSKTYFTEDNIYYEHLKDFGVIYYMQTLSTNGQQGYDRYDMPTVGLRNITIEERNKKVTEIFPKFEQDLKENILEYGKTAKSLRENETLIFQVRITRCPDCGIPSTLELSVKPDVLKSYAEGKMDKATALSKIVVKRGAVQ